MQNIEFVIAILAVSVSVASAGMFSVPAAPETLFVDTESVTNAAMRTSLIQRARTFSCDISFFATPSNMLEVAFGTSRNGDGILLPGDETFSLGWENGAWIITSSTNRIVAAAQEGASRRNLSFFVRMSEGGVPTTFTISGDNVGDTFAPLSAAPPAWLFSRAWDTVRTTVNGVDSAAETVTICLDNNPWLFIAR